MIACAGPAADAPPAATGRDAAAVELRPVTVEEWRIELARLEGRIAVVDMWATWCIPCIERFPHMVELFHRYEAEGVTFVSVCLDDPGDEQAVASARRFLEGQRAVFANYLITENTADAFEKLDLLSIPAVFIYAADGELRYRLTADDPNDQFTDSDVEAAISNLLGELPLV